MYVIMFCSFSICTLYFRDLEQHSFAFMGGRVGGGRGEGGGRFSNEYLREFYLGKFADQVSSLLHLGLLLKDAGAVFWPPS